MSDPKLLCGQQILLRDTYTKARKKLVQVMVSGSITNVLRNFAKETAEQKANSWLTMCLKMGFCVFLEWLRVCLESEI